MVHIPVHSHHIPKVGLEYRNQTVEIKLNKCFNANKHLSSILPPGYWRGRRCFILGGGPSLKGFDFSVLTGELTIGINKAFEHYPNTTINYSMDSGFYDKIVNRELDGFAGMDIISKWKNFSGIRVFITPIAMKKFGDEVYVIKKTLSRVINPVLDAGVYGGSNSGTGAIALAATLGANPIYLLGYDMKANTKTHWHEGYENRDMAHFRKKLNQYCEEIEKFAPVLEAHNIKVVNLNEDSNLRCFSFDKLEHVLRGEPSVSNIS